MIMSHNRGADIPIFASVVDVATDCLNCGAQKNPAYFAGRGGTKLEDDVFEALKLASKGTQFEDTLEVKSAQYFPDIVADGYFGVEVKSTTANKWTSTGSSIAETSRVESVERIFLTFGKLADPIEFRSRPYEECLADMAVTHSPRYLLNMELERGETLAEKMGTTYDELRLNNPLHRVVAYKKSLLGDGERLWWHGEDRDTQPVLRHSNKLNKHESDTVTIEGMAYFPEIFGASPKKYERFALWLVTERMILAPAVRDFFSAGGKVDIEIGYEVFEQFPQKLHRVDVYKNEIARCILHASEAELMDTWDIDYIEDNRILQWVKLVSYFTNQCTKELENTNRPVGDLLRAVFGL